MKKYLGLIPELVAFSSDIYAAIQNILLGGEIRGSAQCLFSEVDGNLQSVSLYCVCTTRWDGFLVAKPEQKKKYTPLGLVISIRRLPEC